MRRKFVELEEQYPEQSKQILDMIGELYGVDRDGKTGPPDALLALRQERSKPIIRRIHDWALSTSALPQSPLHKAIAYMGSMWDGLQVFLDDPHVELDNNRTERALRGVVIGRKNTLRLPLAARHRSRGTLLQPDREREAGGRRPAHVLARCSQRGPARR